jgi:hypothetical protein
MKSRLTPFGVMPKKSNQKLSRVIISAKAPAAGLDWARLPDFASRHLLPESRALSASLRQ